MLLDEVVNEPALLRLPPAGVRRAIRELAGVPRPEMAAALRCSVDSLKRAEDPSLPESRTGILRDLSYRQALSWCLRQIAERDKATFDVLVTGMHETEVRRAA